MIKLNDVLFGLTLILLLSSCNKDKDNAEDSQNGYLVFGNFYGHCVGPNCISVYKLEGGNLYESTEEIYPSRTELYETKYKQLDQNKFNIASILLKNFPANLLNENDTVFGCPDCADQGGVYLEVSSGEGRRFWILDQFKQDIPEYTHKYLDEVNKVLEQLKEE